MHGWLWLLLLAFLAYLAALVYRALQLKPGASAARHFAWLSEHVYRFSGIQVTKEELALAHGQDERIRLSALSKAVAFYIALIEQL